ncbi:hypothetical protein N9500_05835 [Candidatus Pelagibacter sp.]|nr:hypothetical protein [Candidatus Pelagibacter sp.]
MKKIASIIFMSLFFCNVVFADIYHLRCKYGDGTGNEKIFIDTNKKIIRWSNDIREEEYALHISPGSPTRIRGIKKGTISVERLSADLGKSEPKGNYKMYKTDIDVLDFDLWNVMKNQSNSVQGALFSTYLYFYIDEENKERIFMPTEKEFKDTTKGKDLYYSEFGRSSGHNFRLNCTKY